MVSILTLLLVMTLSILLTRVATVALTHTGLSRESAKFQARSAFTGVGFTTRLVVLWSFAASKRIDRHLSNLISIALIQKGKIKTGNDLESKLYSP